MQRLSVFYLEPVMTWRSRERADFCLMCLGLSHTPGPWRDLVLLSPQTSYLSHIQNNHIPRTGVISQEVKAFFQNTEWSCVLKLPDMGTGIEIRSPGKVASYLQCWTISRFCSLWQHTHRTHSRNCKPHDTLVSEQRHVICNTRWSQDIISHCCHNPLPFSSLITKVLIISLTEPRIL